MHTNTITKTYIKSTDLYSASFSSLFELYLVVKPCWQDFFSAFFFSLAQLTHLTVRAIVTTIITLITAVVAPILAQHQHHQGARQRPVVVYVLIRIPPVLHIAVDMVQLSTGKLIQYDVFIDTYIFCLFLVIAMER
jgi:hypothetical protein